jgi:G:T-mismatch repair DNA endonuclease (very short patch repair protein)
LCCSPEPIYWDSFGFKANVNQDRIAQEELKSMGWKILIIWECELSDLDKVKRFLKESL